MKDRIKLAEVMEWKSHGAGYWSKPGCGLPLHSRDAKLLMGPPDPFTDANDDYAVLEWMRQKCKLLTVENANRTDWKMWDKFCSELNDPEDREIGDNARAALKVIE